MHMRSYAGTIMTSTGKGIQASTLRVLSDTDMIPIWLVSEKQNKDSGSAVRSDL